MLNMLHHIPALALAAQGAPGPDIVEPSAFLTAVEEVNNFLNNIFWGWPALILLAFVGIFMTCRTKFFQISHFGHWVKETIGAIFHRDVVSHTQDQSISQFQSLCTALAATVGTGNIVGVAGAIMVGGPGAVFWMWLIAFFGMMTNYSENVLGIFYRRKNSAGEWSGGAMYYLRDGLGALKGCKVIGLVLAVMFSVFCFLASFGIGNMTQINSISGNMESAFGIPTWVTGIAIVILTGLVVLGGLKRIASVTEKIVPFMVILYMVGSIVIFCSNISMIGPVFASIFTRAFSLEAAAGGAVMGENLAWEIADTLNGMMMLPNLIGVLVLSPVVIRITRNYVDRKLRGQNIEPMLSNFPDIQKEAAAAVRAGER